MLVIAGSAGSLDVILTVFQKLKPDFKPVIIIVMHRKNTGDSMLAELFAYKTKIPIREIEDKDPLAAGTIYLAPADYHLLIEKNNTFSLDDSEKINYSRPSIDVTFESAAEIFGSSLVCILLSGANADGVKGLIAVKENGGMAVVQEPSTAEVPYMPEQAILGLKVDLILRADELADFINNLI